MDLEVHFYYYYYYYYKYIVYVWWSLCVLWNQLYLSDQAIVWIQISVDNIHRVKVSLRRERLFLLGTIYTRFCFPPLISFLSPFQLQCLWHNPLLCSRENLCPTKLETIEFDWHYVLDSSLDLCSCEEIYFNLPFLWLTLWEFLPGCIQRQSLFVYLYKTVQ